MPLSSGRIDPCQCAEEPNRVFEIVPRRDYGIAQLKVSRKVVHRLHIVGDLTDSEVSDAVPGSWRSWANIAPSSSCQ